MSNPTRAGMAPPLPRAWLDTIAPSLRVLFGIIFIAWSWISTLLVLGALLVPVVPSATLGGIPDRALIAVGFAFLVSLAEFASRNRWPWPTGSCCWSAMPPSPRGRHAPDLC